MGRLHHPSLATQRSGGGGGGTPSGDDWRMDEFAVHRANGFVVGWFAAILSVGAVLNAAFVGGYTLRERVLTIAVSVVVGSVAYLFGLRPSVEERPTCLVVHNPFRDTTVPWRSFSDAHMADVLVIEAGRDIRCFAIALRRERVSLAAVIGRLEPPARAQLDLSARLRALAERMSVGESGGEVLTTWVPGAVVAASLVLGALVAIGIEW